MNARRTITPAMTRRILCRQGIIPCCLCGKRITAKQKTVMEHLHALALGGADDEENMGLAHEECAAKKTNGTKATTAGSDKHAIAKGKRLRGETGQNRRKAKIANRGFDKSKRLKLNGKVEERNA